MTASLTTKLSEGATLNGDSGRTYLIVSPFASNVWSAVDANNQDKVYIIKQPSRDDTNRGWPQFQSEMVMHELFKESPYIRPQVDRIVRQSYNDMPRVVLEAFEHTIWTARAIRPFTTKEIKAIMKSTLLGLRDIHAEGLVYADLKMENVLINGFRKSPNDIGAAADSLVTKLGDLGLVMEPASGIVQPIAYRAPEVYFKRRITRAADIWSWGMIYCHLLEAQASIEDVGMYDSIYTGTLSERERAVRRAIIEDFDLPRYQYYKDCDVPGRDRDLTEEDRWYSRLSRKGVAEEEIEFLRCVLNPDPTQRPTANEILNFEWLDHVASQSQAADAERIRQHSVSAEERLVQRHQSPSAATGASPPLVDPSPAAMTMALAVNPMREERSSHFSPASTPSHLSPDAALGTPSHLSPHSIGQGQSVPAPKRPGMAPRTGTYLKYSNGPVFGSLQSESGTGHQSQPMLQRADAEMSNTSQPNLAHLSSQSMPFHAASESHPSPTIDLATYLNQTSRHASATDIPSAGPPTTAPVERPPLPERMSTNTYLKYSSGATFGATPYQPSNEPSRVSNEHAAPLSIDTKVPQAEGAGEPASAKRSRLLRAESSQDATIAQVNAKHVRVQ